MKPRVIRALATVWVSAGLFAGCMSDNDTPPPPSQLEIRGFQTREYDTADTRLVMKAVLNTLQDMGFIVNSADPNLGLLTASRWNDIQHSKKEIKEARKNETSLSKSLVLDCTVNISEFGKQSRVRANFQQRVLDANGATMQANPITDVKFYQTFFSQVDKGVFLQQEGV
jgi:hypothetical protein